MYYIHNLPTPGHYRLVVRLEMFELHDNGIFSMNLPPKKIHLSPESLADSFVTHLAKEAETVRKLESNHCV